jgi:hypothetical protein
MRLPDDVLSVIMSFKHDLNIIDWRKAHSIAHHPVREEMEEVMYWGGYEKPSEVKEYCKLHNSRTRQEAMNRWFYDPVLYRRRTLS